MVVGMNRREFLTSSIGPLSTAVVLTIDPPPKPNSNPTKPCPSLNPPVDWINEWRHLSWPNNEEILDYHGVRFPSPIMEDIYRQVESLVGQRVVYFVPSINDTDKFRELGGDKWVPLDELKNHTPEENKKVWEESYKIGTLVALRENNGIEVKVSIDEKFQVFPFQSYGLFLGIDSNHTRFDFYNKPIDYKERFVVKSCKIKGFYFKAINNPNGVDFHTGLNTYYKCRMLDMFMYLPGRAYY